MGLIGSLVGGTIGLALGGPLGAVLGAVLGGSFSGRMSGPQLGGAAQYQTAFFVAAFSMLGKLAAADGKVTPSEVQLIQNVIQRELRLPPNEQMFAMRIFHEAVQQPNSFEDFAEQFHQIFRGRPEALQSMLDFLTRLSMADGVMHPEEERLLESAAQIFGMGRNDYRYTKQHYQSGDQLEKYFAILKCPTTATQDDVKKSYRKLVRDFHPDTIQSKGLPEEFKEFASERFREIQEAYEKIQKAKGWK